MKEINPAGNNGIREIHSGNILVVDDNRDNLKIVAAMLEGEGYKVRCVTSGKMAVASATRQPPELILLDVLMPVTDGYEICRILKAEKNTRDVPVVFLSALHEMDDRVKGFDAGGVGFISKPIQQEELYARVRTHIELHRSKIALKKQSELLELRVLNRTEELQKANRRLKESEARFKMLSDLTFEGIIMHRQGLLLDVNKSFCRIFGYSREEIIGEDALKLLVPPRHLKRVLEEFKLEYSRPYEIELMRKDGSLFQCEVEARYIDIDGQRIRVTALRDITEQRRAELERKKLEEQLQQAQKLEAIGALAGGIAHDFNNILSIILGYSEIVQEDLPSHDSSEEKIAEIIKAGTRAKDLVKRILAFSRQGEKELKPLRPHHVVNEVLKMLRPSIPSTIEISRDVPECGLVMGDPTQLNQIMMNLCTNAYHAMRETGGVLGVLLKPVTIGTNDVKTLSAALPPGHYVKLEVSDTGHGMDRATQEKIFDPYFTTKKQGEGTGLGLAVVHGVVKSFGGHISVYSEPDKGTVFRIYLPRINSTDETSGDQAVERIPTGSEHILVVDDDASVARMETHMLINLGYRVSTCTSSPEALGIFRNAPEEIDLVMTDMTMPEMTGMELIRKIRVIRPHIPVVLCTGFSELISEDTAESMGIRKCLMKPVLKKDLAAAVREMLDEDTT